MAQGSKESIEGFGPRPTYAGTLVYSLQDFHPIFLYISRTSTRTDNASFIIQYKLAWLTLVNISAIVIKEIYSNPGIARSLSACEIVCFNSDWWYRMPIKIYAHLR